MSLVSEGVHRDHVFADRSQRTQTGSLLYYCMSLQRDASPVNEGAQVLTEYDWAIKSHIICAEKYKKAGGKKPQGSSLNFAIVLFFHSLF